MRQLLVLFAAVLLSCSKGQPPADTDMGPIPRDSAGFSLALDQTTGVSMTPGNEITLYDNGQVFDAMKEAISRATQSIHVALFIWKPGEPGDSIADAILERTKHGIACKIVVDPRGSKHFKEEVFPRLTAGGCDVHFFRPVGKEGKVLGRNHRKLLVLNGRLAFTGGFGFDKTWLGNGREKAQWRDQALSVRGPAVEEIQQTFAENWLETGGQLLERKEFPKLPQPGETRAMFISSKEEAGGTDAYWMTRLMVTAATKRLWIANAYFAPNDSMKNLILDKVKEGVDVRILVPGPIHDVPAVRATTRAMYKELLAGGVKIWEYQPSMMHAKTMIVDDRFSVVGSINLDPLSLNKLDEGSVVMEDPKLVSELERRFLDDLDVSQQITEQNRPRPSLVGRAFKKLRGTLDR
ncbi:phospholipase D-like domain-containing protein [Archangium lansingense]|uniref:phospholipase D-like domain-containing protein n=1 Tax=Archangium lansingense TaxID=2995310 RepID=UPI003B78A469